MGPVSTTAALASVVSSLLASTPALQVDAQVDSSGQARNQLPGEAVGTFTSLELEPSLRALIGTSAAQLDLRYAPRLLLSSAGSAPPGSGPAGTSGPTGSDLGLLGVRHQGALAGKWAVAPGVQLLADAAVSYGRSDVFGVDPDAKDPLAFLEAVLPAIPDNLNLTATAGAGWRLAPRWMAYGAAGYFAYGATSARSQSLLPLQHGPQLDLGVEHALTPADSVGAEGSASTSVVSNGQRSSIFKLSGSWTHQLTASSRVLASAGGGLYAREGSAASRNGVLPVAQLIYEQDLSERLQRVELRTGAAIGPHLNRVTGFLAERVELFASARYVLRERLLLRGRAGLAREVWGNPDGLQNLGVLTADLSYLLKGGLCLHGGAQLLWERTPGLVPVQTAAAAGASPLHWVAFAGLTYRADHLF